MIRALLTVVVKVQRTFIDIFCFMFIPLIIYKMNFIMSENLTRLRLSTIFYCTLQKWLTKKVFVSENIFYAK